MLKKAHSVERRQCALLALAGRKPGKGQRELHIRENRLVRNEVVALEDKANAMVAVGVPVLVGVVLGRDAVDDNVARVGVVKAAKDVEHGCLTRARWAQNGSKLVVPKRNRHVVERDLRERRHLIGLADVLQLKHGNLADT